MHLLETSQVGANAAAWREGVRLLDRAIKERLDFAFETTLGGNTITQLLAHAASQGIAIYVWYAGLASPELHIERCRPECGGVATTFPKKIFADATNTAA